MLAALIEVDLKIDVGESRLLRVSDCVILKNELAMHPIRAYDNELLDGNG
jgi:hypothetical protein